MSTWRLGAGYEEIENALCAWLKEATGLPVQWANQDAPVPTETAGEQINHTSYGDLFVTSFVPRGLTPVKTLEWDSSRPPDKEAERRSRRPGTLNVTAQLYTPGETTGPAAAFPLLMAAAAALDNEESYGPLWEVGLGLTRRGDVRNLTGLIGSAKQGRAVLALTFEVREVVSDFTGAVTGTRLTTSIT